MVFFHLVILKIPPCLFVAWSLIYLQCWIVFYCLVVLTLNNPVTYWERNTQFFSFLWRGKKHFFPTLPFFPVQLLYCSHESLHFWHICSLCGGEFSSTTISKSPAPAGCAGGAVGNSRNFDLVNTGSEGRLRKTRSPWGGNITEQLNIHEAQKGDRARDFALEIINIHVAFKSVGVDKVPGTMCRVRRDQGLE